MNPYELTAVVTAIANAIAQNMTNEEIAVLLPVLSQLRDTLVTIITHRGFHKKFDKHENLDHKNN